MIRKAYAIRHILLAAFLLAALLPAVVMTAMAFLQARTALETEIGHDFQARANATISAIDRIMLERLQNVASWGQLEVMQELRLGDVDKRLSRFLSELKASYGGVYLALHVVDRQHIIVASSEPASLGQRYTPKPNAAEGQFTHRQVRAMPPNGGPLPLAVDIADTLEGGTAGTLYVIFDWRLMRRVLETSATDGSAIGLFDARGSLIASTKNWSGHAKQQTISASATAPDGPDTTGLGWQVRIAQPRAVALTPVREMGDAFVWLLIVTALVATLVIIPISTSIARPLGRLTGFARSFIRNQRAQPPPPGGPMEIRELSAAFGQMIQDLERLKENLTHAAKLAMVGEMAAALSHEVRTPLGILRSSAQLLLRDPGLSADSREVCGFIVSETERMNRLVNTLLDSARARPLEKLPVDLAELIAHASSLLASQAGKKNITLRLAETADDRATIVDCDREQVLQVLLNLTLNAIQILPEGGTVEIALSHPQGYALIEVDDDGPGIAAEDVELIFDPFFTRRDGGVGLGLAVVRQIVIAHGGEIHAGKSRLGGARFSVRLPDPANEGTMSE